MKVQQKRKIVLLVVLVTILFVFTGTLFNIQIIKKDDYSKNTVSSYTVTVDGTRGEILDRNGVPLVTNRQGNSIVFNAAYFPTDQLERNKIIISLIRLFEQNDTEYNETLPIVLNGDGTYSYAEDSDSYIEWLKSKDMLNLNTYATAENCMDALVERYSLQEYSKEDARKIASVCVGMKRETFSVSYPYTFAEDVSTELVSIIMENSNLYVGVENNIVAYREYADGTLAPHILGRVAKISSDTYASEKEKLEKKISDAKAKDASEEEIENLERNAYLLNDEYGSGGIESAFESYLRGTRGEKIVSTDSDGNVSETYTVTPTQGNSIVTTIDYNLQKVAQEALKKRISTLNVSTELPVAAGAVVVMNVNTGEILACATYPSYDNSTWDKNYSKWASDTIGSPLWNRATMSTYEPGSTFKPCIAIAGLEEGTIDEKFTYTCDGYYHYFTDIEFGCSNKKAHGVENVTGAIADSCNCFFYETGRLLGIEKMNKWATAFGFGQKTGIEIPEKQGILAGREYRESQGGVWRPGDTVQAAIGQSDNQFTLLQMCNYCATIANGGTRYVPHFINAIMSYDYSNSILVKEAEIAAKLDINQHNLELVKKGMYIVGTAGFCKEAFADLPVKAAAKTGTSQVKKIYNGRLVKGNNGFLISFAPYDNPEIAIATVVETANSGKMTASISADIYKYYFSDKELQSVQQYNELLK